MYMENSRNEIDRRLKTYNNYVDTMTHKYQKIYEFKIGVGEHSTWNNQADAFKHTFAAADISIRHGEFTSYIGGINHEYGNHNNPVGEKNMDYWNNSKGKAIANELEKEYGPRLQHMSKEQIADLIAPKIMEKMHKGELITTPSDKRKYVGTDEKIGDFLSNIRDKHNITGFASDVDFSSSGENKVFTREDVRNMSKEEFKANEPKIMKQVYAIGLPTKAEVIANEKKSKSLPSSHRDTADGANWVTINGNHVLLN